MNSKFPEPRGWALAWDGTALCATVDCASPQEDAHDAATSPAGWVPQWKQYAATTTPVSQNGHGRNGLTSPRGWALYWDGAALDVGANGHEPVHVPASEPREVGAS